MEKLDVQVHHSMKFTAMDYMHIFVSMERKPFSKVR